LGPTETATAPLLVRSHVLRLKARLEPCLTKLVVELPLFRVAQHVMSKRDLLKPLFGLFVAGVDIRVILAGQLAVGFFDVCGGGGAANAEHLVQVFLWHLSLGLSRNNFPDLAGSNLAERGDDFLIL
jgi:hypothetical protein